MNAVEAIKTNLQIIIILTFWFSLQTIIKFLFEEPLKTRLFLGVTIIYLIIMLYYFKKLYKQFKTFESEEIIKGI